jgi:hypothetical protein
MPTSVNVDLRGNGQDWTVSVNGERQARSDLMTLWAMYGVIVRQLDAAFVANPHLDRRR